MPLIRSLAPGVSTSVAVYVFYLGLLSPGERRGKRGGERRGKRGGERGEKCDGRGKGRRI